MHIHIQWLTGLILLGGAVLSIPSQAQMVSSAPEQYAPEQVMDPLGPPLSILQRYAGPRAPRKLELLVAAPDAAGKAVVNIPAGIVPVAGLPSATVSGNVVVAAAPAPAPYIEVRSAGVAAARSWRAIDMFPVNANAQASFR